MKTPPPRHPGPPPHPVPPRHPTPPPRQVLRQRAQRKPGPEPAVAIRAWQPNRTIRKRRISLASIRDLILLASTIATATYVYRQHAAGNLDFSRISALVAKLTDEPANLREDPVQRTEHVVPERSPQRSIRSQQPIERTAPPSMPQSASLRSDDGPQLRNGSLAPLLEEPAAPTVIELATIQLDVSSGRQMAALPEEGDHASLRIARVAGLPQSVRMTPEDGKLSVDSKVELFPFGDRSIYLEAVMVEPAGDSPKLMIDVKSDLPWIGDNRVSLQRLKRQRDALAKLHNAALARRAVVANEIGTVTAYLNSHTPKLLADRGRAKDRLQTLQGMMPGLNGQVAATLQQVRQFEQFCRTITSTLDGVSLVLAEVEPPAVAEAADESL